MPMLWDLVNGMSIDKAGYSASVILDYYSSFRVDYIVFIVVLVFTIIFERTVVPVELGKNTV